MIKPYLRGKVLVLGIGNTLRSDDGFGSLFARQIRDKVSFLVIDTGGSPENYLEKVIRLRPDNIIIVDALDFAGKPGEIRILKAEDLQTSNLFFSHNCSLTLLINYLQNHLPANIILLIVQPKDIRLGNRLTPKIKESLKRLEKAFLQVSL